MVFLEVGNGLSYFCDFFCLSKSDNSLIVYFIEENRFFYTWVLFWSIIIGCLLVRLSWIKIDMPDIKNCDIWIKTFMLENNWKGFSSTDTNSEATYQLWFITKLK